MSDMYLHDCIPNKNTVNWAPCHEQSNPITGLDRPWGFQKLEAPRFQDNRHMKVVSLSALRTGRLYTPGNIPGTHFCLRQDQPQGHTIMSLKNSNDIIGNRTRDLPECRAVPHPTAPPRVSWIHARTCQQYSVDIVYRSWITSGSCQQSIVICTRQTNTACVSHTVALNLTTKVRTFPKQHT